ncbi:MAG: 4-coumarate--CoA ligase family protein [Gammaproteobacteria bacterium]|nr:MAG: 4-coumarate--CoA ligase family protein [Gammaproteobacteria bacterium]
MIFRSPHPDIDIPDRVSLPEFIFEDVASFADKTALIDGPSGRSLTYGELYRDTQSYARGLHDRGFTRGDVFAIYCPNMPEYAVVFYAVAMLGGINTTINPLYTVDELARQLNDAGARYLLTIPPFAENALAAAAQSSIEEVFVIGEAEGATPWTSLMREDGELPSVAIDPREDLVVLPYSSGTTGLPKGVMLTHYNLVANISQFRDIGGVTDEDRLIAILPFFHIFGMVVLMAYGLLQRTTVVTMPRFDLPQFLQLMQDHAISRAFLVPPIVLALAKNPTVDDYDLSALKFIFCGAAPLSREVTLSCSERLDCLVSQGYGMTEMSPATNLDDLDPAKIRPGSIGRLMPNTEAKIVDVESGEALGPNQQGEYCVRGPQRMPGYLNNPEATAESIDADGWYHSGDIGYIDEDGYAYIVDRVKELIKYKAMQVAPAELEAVLLSHEAIIDAAVVPCPDEEAGEIPKAYVVTNAEIDAEAIMDYVAERVAPHKKIRALEFTDEIPKSPSGKILRRLLVERERS